MGALKRKVSQLTRLLDRGQKQANRLPVIMDKLEHYFKEKPKEIVDLSLFLLQYSIDCEAAKGAQRLAVVIISPDLAVNVNETRDMDSDSWLQRLKSEGFAVLTLEQFRSLIRYLRLGLTQEKYMPAIKFLKANADFQTTLSPMVPSVRKVKGHGKPSASSKWKLSDLLPAPPPHLPVPKAFFKE